MSSHSLGKDSFLKKRERERERGREGGKEKSKDYLGLVKTTIISKKGRHPQYHSSRAVCSIAHYVVFNIELIFLKKINLKPINVLL